MFFCPLFPSLASKSFEHHVANKLAYNLQYLTSKQSGQFAILAISDEKTSNILINLWFYFSSVTTWSPCIVKVRIVVL